MVRINLLDWLALLVVTAGAFNWGFIGVFEINLVKEIFGSNIHAIRTVYIIEGLAALYMTYFAFKLAQ